MGSSSEVRRANVGKTWDGSWDWAAAMVVDRRSASKPSGTRSWSKWERDESEFELLVIFSKDYYGEEGWWIIQGFRSLRKSRFWWVGQGCNSRFVHCTHSNNSGEKQSEGPGESDGGEGFKECQSNVFHIWRKLIFLECVYVECLCHNCDDVTMGVTVRLLM